MEEASPAKRARHAPGALARIFPLRAGSCAVDVVSWAADGRVAVLRGARSRSRPPPRGGGARCGRRSTRPTPRPPR